MENAIKSGGANKGTQKNHIPFKYSRAYQSNLKKGDPKFVKFEQQRQSMTQEQINSVIPSLFSDDSQQGVKNPSSNKIQQNNIEASAPKQESKMFPELNAKLDAWERESQMQEDNVSNVFSKSMYLFEKLNQGLFSDYNQGGRFNYEILSSNGEKEMRYDLTNSFQVSFSREELNDFILQGVMPEEFYDELTKEIVTFLETEDFNFEVSGDSRNSISFNTKSLSKALYIAKMFNQDSVLFWKFCEEGNHILDLNCAFIYNKEFEIGKKLEPNEWVEKLDILREMNGNG